MCVDRVMQIKGMIGCIELSSRQPANAAVGLQGRWCKGVDRVVQIKGVIG